MCLIVTLVMFILAIQSFMQHQWIAGILQIIISFGFLALLIRNILAVKNQKEGCNTTDCSSTEWFVNLFKKKAKK